MKKDTNTEDILDHLTEDELRKVIMLKTGIEDLNLILQELEQTYDNLSEETLEGSEVSYHKYRLKILEKLMDDVHKQMSDVVFSEIENQKLS